jgi:protocatechuate 3,4-dioxygenase beta subunit
MSDDAREQQHNIYDLGLQADLAMWTRKPLERRRILKMGLVGIGVLLAGCGSVANAAIPATSTTAPAAATTATTATATAATAATTAVAEIPQETAGPYPADGSQASNNSLNALALSGIVRSDIRTSLGTGHVAAGIPTKLELTLVNVNQNSAPLAGYAMYLWHCDRDGNYSMYSNGVTAEDYLRGVQQSDSNGVITFTTIFPACYSGRWPHIHFEVFDTLESAVAGEDARLTSQIAVPQDACATVFAYDTGYANSVSNLSKVSLDSDNVFGDGWDAELATVTGDPPRV